MNIYTKNCIEAAEKIIADNVKYNIKTRPFYSEYSKPFFWTNEAIPTYLDKVNLKDKDSALTVLSSGDHLFNLVAKGILDVDTFDINKLTEYFALGFKKAMILKYSYLEFIEVIKKIYSHASFDEIASIITDLFPYMEPSHKVFWQSLLDYCYNLQKNTGEKIDIFRRLTISSISYDISYIEDESVYNTLQSNLRKANITFNNCNAFDLSKNYKGRSYDIIMLSNILDFANEKWGNDWKYRYLKEYERRLKKLLNEKGIIFLHYMFVYFPNVEPVFLYSSVKQKNLTNEKIIAFDNYLYGRSAIVLTRKKSKK